MADEDLVKTVQSTFSMYGLIVSRNVSTYVAKQLLTVDADQRDFWLTQIADQIVEHGLNGPHVEVEDIKHAIQECVKPENVEDSEFTTLSVINAREVPKIVYDHSKKKFVLTEATAQRNPFLPDHKYLLSMFKERFELVLYRTLAHELFAAPKVGESETEKMTITPIEYLLSETKTANVCVMGRLSRAKDEDIYFLQDQTAKIQINFQNADSLISLGNIVLATGNYDKAEFCIDGIGYPPEEPSENTRANFGNVNTFGGPSKTSLKNSEKLKYHEESNLDAMIVFVSDVALDNSTVLSKIKMMFDGYSEFPPVAFVFCGHFLTVKPHDCTIRKMKQGFADLSEIIQQYPSIRNTSTFILVPSLIDIGSPEIFPRLPLPKYIVEEFVKNVPNTVLATNPCRIQYCTKEIVVMRDDALDKLCRNRLHKESNDGNMPYHFAKSIICQSHLTPVKLKTTPVCWPQDHVMYLYPTPDLIVVADEYEAYTTNYANCHVINPGTFSANEYSFKVYVPGQNIIEECQIPNVAVPEENDEPIE